MVNINEMVDYSDNLVSTIHSACGNTGLYVKNSHKGSSST
jgi:hypothetical protein